MKTNISDVGLLGAFHRHWGDGQQMVSGDIFDHFGFPRPHQRATAGDGPCHPDPGPTGPTRGSRRATRRSSTTSTTACGRTPTSPTYPGAVTLITPDTLS